MPCLLSDRDHGIEVMKLTFCIMTSYAEMRSVATKRRVFESTSNKSRTFPSAIFGRAVREVEVTAVSAIVFIV